MTERVESRTVLIVDDDQELSGSLADVLRPRGHTVLTATNREQTLGVLSDSTPDAVLLDVRLGSEKGLDLLPDIHAREPLVPIIIMTAHATTETAIAALQRGAYDYLQKPFKIPGMLATLDRAFSHVSLARDKARAEGELKRTNETLSLLNARLRRIVETATRVASVPSIDDLSSELLHIFASHLGASGGTLLRVEDGLLRRDESLDRPHVPEVIELPPRPGSVLARALETDGGLLLTDAKSSGWNGYLDGSCLAFTIRAGQQEPAYVVTLHNPLEPPFTTLDLELGSLISSFLSEEIRSLRTRGALRRQEALYRYLFEKSQAINIMLSTDGKLISLNQNALDRLGYTAADLTGSDPTRLVIDEDRELTRARIQKLLDGQQMPGTGLRVRASDDSIRVFYFPSGSGVVVRGADVEPTILVTALDVTERKLQEQALFQASKLVSLGTLASGIAHEVNNPNSYIRMNAQNLSELCRRASSRAGHDDNMNSELAELLELGREMLDGVVEGSQRIESLVAQLREFVRQEPQKLTQPVAVNQVVDTAGQLLSPMIRRSTRSFERRLTEKLPAVRGDCHQLEQVVMNLLSNACQAVEEMPGTVEIATGYRDGQVYVSVRDDGPGIPAADLDRITDPFFTTKRTRGGTGLGLSVSARIVDQHGGRLVFDSKADAGTTATVWLPAEEDGR